ncbi:Ig-like domain-containing protein [Propionibacterium australiense]|uniref:SDR-like Ig domain-containing protein n=1 Tax=Propionibacterium australiense TaxID=119981 RepID=A0A8B3FQZ9_9ACTN|nr:Ig-like domain-containing protein [Propionibacterium australiense]RLP08203.1 hypothetical protein D7U36_10100 [Propionibacterium australiense]
MKKLRTTGLALLTLALALPTASGIALAEPTTEDDPAAPVTVAADDGTATETAETDGDAADAAPYVGSADVSSTACSSVVGADRLASTITTFSNTQIDALTAGSSYRMNITGSLANGHCAGDTITVAISHPLKANANASYPIYATDGTLAGQLVVNGDGTQATLTLNEWVSTRNNVELDAYLAVSVATTATEQDTATWTVDNTTYTKPITPGTEPCTDCDTMPSRAAKWGNYTQNDGDADDTIRIVVQIPTSTAPKTTFTITDTLGAEGQRFSCVEDDLNWRYYTSLRPDGNLGDGDSTYDTLAKTDTSQIAVQQVSCDDTTFTATVTIAEAGVASRLYIPVLVTDERRTEFPDTVTVTSDQGYSGGTTTTVYNDKGGGTLSGNDMAPGIEIVKTDADGNDADTEAEAVDLTETDGSTQLVLTITNAGSERLRDVTVTDEIARGAGSVSNLDCDFSKADPEAPTSGTAWEGPFLIGASFTCTADLSGVTGETHEDVASVDATGWFTGKAVHGDNPYHATSTPPAEPSTPATPDSSTPSSSAPAPSQSSPTKKMGLPRPGVDGASGLAAVLVLAGLGTAVARRSRR